MLKLIKGADRDVVRVQREELRAYAAQIQDEAQWSHILSQATPESRQELERVLGPLLRFRRHACASPGCEGKPEYQPVLTVRASRFHDPIWAPLELRYCSACKDAIFGASALLTDDIWSQIVAQCEAAGEYPPAKYLTVLSWDREH